MGDIPGALSGIRLDAERARTYWQPLLALLTIVGLGIVGWSPPRSW
jgi:hypothetical protein